MPQPVVLLLFLAHLSISLCQNPVVTFGRTEARVGDAASFSLDAQRGYKAFQDALGTQMTIGGVVHDVKHVVYNDGSDPQLIEILYERLIDHDHVDFLFSTIGFGMKAIAVAEANGVPIMNCGVFEIFGQPTAWKWVTTVLTPLQALYNSCGSPLYEKGARTIGLALVSGISPIAPLLVGSFTPVTAVDVVAADVFRNEKSLDALVLKYKALHPDVFVAAGTVTQMLALIDRIRRNKYEPKAIHIVAGAAPDAFAQEATWKASDLLITSDFEPSLNYTDSLYGSSMKYQQYLLDTFNSSSSISDTYYAQAGTVLVESILAAGTIDRTAVMKKLRSYNGTTIAGPTSFDAQTGYLQRPYFCFQFTPDGSLKKAVNPLTLPNSHPIVYPADRIRYAKGFFPKNKKKVVTIVVPVVGGVVLLLAIAGAIVYFVIRQKYHLVFVPKDVGAQEEWAT